MVIGQLLSVADRLALSLDGLGRAVAGRVASRLLTAVMILLVWRRVSRVKGRILGLLARFQAGTLRVCAMARVGGPGGRGGAGTGRLPIGFGWLLPLVPGEAACFAGQVRAMLAEPEMVALLRAAPQARRVLRPLCRMLGIEREMLAPAGVVSADMVPAVDWRGARIDAGGGAAVGAVPAWLGGEQGGFVRVVRADVWLE